jgi:hypothetical protein
MNPLIVMLAAATSVPHPIPRTEVADIVVYGCSPAGIVAAVEAKREKRSVALICRDAHVGGITTNGLGWADTGDHAAIGGMAKQFYRDVRRYYAARGVAFVQGQPQSTRDDAKAMYVFEPHVAEAIFERWLRDAGIVPIRSTPLRRDGHGVAKVANHIVSLSISDGRVFRGREFIDASYEGDLMAEAGVQFTIGREANATFGETLNGIQNAQAIHHQFDKPIDPYVVSGKPSSGLLPRIEAGPAGTDGEADARVQAYTYRLCMTKLPANRAPIPRPANYDPRQYELLGRYLDAGWRDLFSKYDSIPGGKTDTNNYGAFSMDDIGMNYGYPNGSDVARAQIADEHRAYQQGLLWFMQNDLRSPSDVRAAMKPWGLCADEFKDNAHWPHEMYVREARRMAGAFVMTERHLLGRLPAKHSIGLGSYNIDSHNVRRYVDLRGHARNEGNIEVNPGRYYEISYEAVTPRKAQANNLLVPVALSASHIAYGSIRTEPVFMILGQSVATAAGIALDDRLAVQDVPYKQLRPRLLTEGQLISVRSATSTSLMRVRSRLLYFCAIMSCCGLIVASVLYIKRRTGV